MSDNSKDWIFFLCIYHDTIMKMRPDGSDLQVVLKEHCEMPDGLTLDLHEYVRTGQEKDVVLWLTNMGPRDTATGERCHLPNASIVACRPFAEGAPATKVPVRAPTKLIGGERNKFPAGEPLLTTLKQTVLSRDGTQLFFCDREGHGVKKYNTRTQEVVPLLHADDVLGTDEKAKELYSVPYCDRFCVGITLDEDHDTLFFTLKGSPHGGHGRIVAAPYVFSRQNVPAGAEAEGAEGSIDPAGVVVLREGLPEPIDLLYDSVTGFLYWTDRGDPAVEGGNALSRAAVTYGADGKPALGPSEVIVDGFADAIGLSWAAEDEHLYPAASPEKQAALRQYMYVGDVVKGHIYRVDIEQKKKELIHAGAGVTGVRYMRGI